jgi:hypothetical protein
VKLGKSVHSLGGDIGVATAAVSSFGTQLAVGAFDGLDVQHNLLAPSISLGAVSVVGDVQTNSLQNNGGAFHNQASFPASSMPRLPMAVGSATGTTNISVAPLQTTTLSPGSYGTLTDKGTVLLNPGAYSFTNVVLGEFAQLQAKSGGATTIFVGGTFSADDNVQVYPIHQTADKLAITVAGSDGANSSSPAASFGENGHVVALLAVPHGTLSFGENLQGTGAFAAFDVVVGDGGFVTFQAGFTATASYPQGTQMLTGHAAPAIVAGNVPLVGPLPGSTNLSLSIGLPLQNQSGLQTLLTQLYDPRSSSYRKYIQPSDFAANFTSPSDYSTLQTFATANGLTVKQTFTSGYTLLVSGTAAAIESAFFTALNVYQKPDGTTFYAPANEPSANLSATVLHIRGFDSFAVPIPADGGGGTGPQICTPTFSATAKSYAGQDFRSIYLCPGVTADGTGQTVGLFEPGTFYPNDLVDYQTLVPSTNPTISPTTVVVGNPAASLATLSGNCSAVPTTASFQAGANCQNANLNSAPADQQNNSGAEPEVALDIETVASMAPGAAIRVYSEDQSSPTNAPGTPNVAYNPDLILQSMADENLAKVLSSSWQWIDLAQDTSLPNYFLQFAVQGQSFFQDAGDWGAWTTGNPLLPTVPDPVIDSALMTVVGGTRLATTGSGAGLQWSSEVAWNDFAAGAARPAQTTAALSGGGICSAYTNGMGNPFAGLPMPTYQQKINSGNPDLTNVTSRTIPDVSMVAENFSSYFGVIASSTGIIYDPILSCGVGTSYATPMWAGLMALANQTAANLGQGAIGFANPTLYARAAGYAPSATGPFFHDVTRGNNQYPGESTFFTATTGYDLVTGLGSPVGCSLVPSLPPQSCMTGSSLSAIVDNVNKVVTAYVPNGSWGEPATGISVFAVEGSGSDTTIATGSDVINTCAGNSLTGEVVCTSNGTNVYLINGTATKTVTSGANASEHFSGGDCQTCNVAVDPIHNTAYMSIGIANGSSTAAEIQPLNLSTGAVLSAFPLGQQRSSEDLVVDAVRGFVLSPNEGPFNPATVPGDYQLVDTTNGSVFDFNPGLSTYTTGGLFDAAAEDCSTGIALASMEFSNQLFLVDLSQATFSGTTWSAPFTFQTAPEIAFGTASSPTGGPIAVAPNSHLGVTASEFGGNGIGVFQLPSKSGTGGSAPQLLNYVAATMPSDPNGNTWQNGQDPHNLTAYTSPNNGKQYAIVEEDASQNGTRTFLAIVDMQAMLSLPTTSSDPHTVSGNLVSCEGAGVNGTPSVANCVVRFVP